ncbi:hypothetical protein QQZ08_000402 [Neonectria magnoliae]|uniref:AB hydrolase-1 domain-containing protein n=1 Tax=Neonectria magnoliae TaxID=2732573 RepID=A0ABR1IJU4_9HYPO
MASDEYAMYQLSEDSTFHFEILRVLAQAVYDGADVGEILVTANNIISSDLDSYANAFTNLAHRVYKRATSIAKKKFPVSARTAFFAAASYFRSADFYLHDNASDPRIMTLWANQTAAFDQGLALLSTPNHRLTLSTPDFDIPAIWFTPDDVVKQRPTIILGNGYDGSQEEMYHVVGAAALERGWNVLSYEGPGQPSPRRYQDIGFIYDWERVITPVVDHLVAQPELVDPDAIALLGLSFGGYLAPRAAAFEHRLAAILAIDGVWDFGNVTLGELSDEALALWEAGNKTAFDEVALEWLNPGYPAQLRWALAQGLWSFNLDSPFDYIAASLNYTLEGVVDKIKTPVFIGDAENDLFFKGQPQQLADALGNLGYLYHFTNEDGIGEHCGLGALKQQNAVIFDWLDGILEEKRNNALC